MSDDWITTRQAAEISGYHPEYLRELIRTNKIVGRKFGTLWQVDKQSLIAYLEAGDSADDKRWGPRS